MNLAQWLQRGKPIPGSCYYRDFCALCGEPIRVPKSRLNVPNVCRDCRGHQAPPPRTGLTKRQRYGLARTDS